MPTQTIAQATIDASIMEQATVIYAEMGLTVSDAIQIMLRRTIAEHALPFDPFTPNQTTIDAMLAAKRGEGETFKTVEELMADLHADD